MTNQHDTAKHIVDAASIGVWAAALMEWLPAVAAVVSIIWGCIRIYETHTVQRMLGKTHRRKEDTPDDACKDEE